MATADEQEDDRFDDDFSGPSKSQLKREATALQKLGEQLTTLTPVQLEKIPLPVELREAIHAAQQMRRHGARRRQLQFIGKLMRRIDTEPIQLAVDGLKTGQNTAQHRQIEQFCAALLTEDAASLNEFLTHYPDTDRQHLRHLIRNAVREQLHQKPPRSRRALFRYLREVVTAG
ncbi:MAG: ribosome biogenesis factor YjgA [Candidatus Competibacteraceae bacterium]|jgi:ribosome-associated protein|nr:ribosome biogenesis factor YjgA [Candidatus Competibacteraceae bacterium]